MAVAAPFALTLVLTGGCDTDIDPRADEFSIEDADPEIEIEVEGEDESDEILPSQGFIGDQGVDPEFIEESCPAQEGECMVALAKDLGLSLEPPEMDAASGECVQCTTYWNYFYFSCPNGWFMDAVSWWQNNYQSGWCGIYFCAITPVSGTISASPKTVYSAGVGSTKISWNASCGSTAQVWISENGLPEKLFAQDLSGTQNAPWISAGSQYDFCLYAGTQHSDQLDCVHVVGKEKKPEFPPLCPGCGSGSSCHCEPDQCWPNGLACP